MATAKLEAQAGKLTIVIEQGTTFNPIFTYTDDAAPPVPIDLTGYTARMQIKLKQTDIALIDELTTENGGLTLGGVAGTIALFINDVDTAAYTFSQAVYDLEIISSGGIVVRLLQGSVILSTETTT